MNTICHPQEKSCGITRTLTLWFINTRSKNIVQNCPVYTKNISLLYLGLPLKNRIGLKCSYFCAPVASPSEIVECTADRLDNDICVQWNVIVYIYCYILENIHANATIMKLFFAPVGAMLCINKARAIVKRGLFEYICFSLIKWYCLIFMNK